MVIRDKKSKKGNMVMHTGGCQKNEIGKGGLILKDILTLKLIKPQCLSNKCWNGVLYSFRANAFGKIKTEDIFSTAFSFHSNGTHWQKLGMILKFMFSKKATKIDKIFTVEWHYVVSVISMVEILSIFVAFLENMNFTKTNMYLKNFSNKKWKTNWKVQFLATWLTGSIS